MISPEQALRAIRASSRALRPLTVKLDQALGLVLAAPVSAPYPYPLFDNAALDGYAVRWRDTLAAKPREALALRVRGSQFAGQAWKQRLGRGEALHVTTGAPMPTGSDALVPYEAVRREGEQVWLAHPARAGQNVRRRGEDAKRGQRLAGKGERLHARRLSMLAAFGVVSVKVHPRPRVALAVSGDELLKPGPKPKAGQIFDSNTPALRSLLREAGLEPVLVVRLPDEEKAQTARLKAALRVCDVLLVAGGMSVGEKDLGKSILESLGVRRQFWKVAQKPGKPLYFGLRGRQLVFGLPGNPAAVISCFAAYVLPTLRKLAGSEDAGTTQASLMHALPANGDKALLLKAHSVNIGGSLSVTVLNGQGSHLLRSLAEGNALVLRPAGSKALKRGQKVELISFD